MSLKSVDAVLLFAIGKEEEAAAFYRGLAERMEMPHMRQVFQDFAAEELTHKQKLEGVLRGKQLAPVEEKVLNLGIGEHLVDLKPTPDMDYKQALIVAMKEEKAAFAMYLGLADAAGSPGIRELFLKLAQEEARHKLRFELEYDDQFSGEN
jgi:rubrerythrin